MYSSTYNPKRVEEVETSSWNNIVLPGGVISSEAPVFIESNLQLISPIRGIQYWAQKSSLSFVHACSACNDANPQKFIIPADRPSSRAAHSTFGSQITDSTLPVIIIVLRTRKLAALLYGAERNAFVRPLYPI